MGLYWKSWHRLFDSTYKSDEKNFRFLYFYKLFCFLRERKSTIMNYWKTLHCAVNQSFNWSSRNFGRDKLIWQLNNKKILGSPIYFNTNLSALAEVLWVVVRTTPRCKSIYCCISVHRQYNESIKTNVIPYGS